MFLGQFNHSLDKKGRVIMPAKFRDYLSEGVIITKSPDGCLAVFPKNEWQKVQENIRTVSADHDSRMISRILFSGASEESIDKQGRLPVPAILRSYAGLSDEAVVIGLSGHIEIWDKAKWETYQGVADSAYTNIAAGFSELGF